MDSVRKKPNGYYYNIKQ